jgi:hypothetical protein
LHEEFLVPLGMSARAMAKHLGVPANRMTEIMRGTLDGQRLNGRIKVRSAHQPGHNRAPPKAKS